MPKRPRSPDMVNMLVQVPTNIRNGLREITKQTGLTTSQQVRRSLAMWIRSQTGKPIETLASMNASPVYGTVPDQWADPPEPELGPEPDIKADPAAWASWSAKQGDWMIKQLAKGKFKT